MNYQRIYDSIIQNAKNRLTITSASEWHHIIPTSMGGRDHPSNIVLLTPREHFICHLLLFKMGHVNQIFSVQCFLQSTDPARKLNPKIRWTKFIRKHLNKIQQQRLREKRRQYLTDSW